MRTISEARCFRLEERIYLRLLAEQHIEEDSRRLLKTYVEELLRPDPDDLFSFITESDEYLKQKWDVLDEYFARPGLLTESKKVLVEGLLSSAWQGFKDFAKEVGTELLDGAVWVTNNAKKIGKKYGEGTVKLLKKLGGKIHDVMIYAIKLLPGGEIVLEFLSKVAGSLKEKIQEMAKAIGKRVADFVNSAKEKIIDLFFKHVIKDPTLKADLMGALGLNEGKLNNIFLLAEEPSKSQKVGLELVAKKLGLPSPDDTKKVVQALQGKSEKGEDPASALRGAGADVVEKLIEFWLKLVEQNPKKYHKPFFTSKFFEPLGTGFGFAAAAILGILAASELPWNDLVTYVKSIMRGFAGGMDKPEGAETKYAAAYLFLGNKSNNYDATLFKSFITGIIRGSNLEVITRALLGDVSKIPDLIKRILKTIVNGIKENINKASKKALEAEGLIDDKSAINSEDVENGFGAAMEAYVDAAFPS